MVRWKRKLEGISKKKCAFCGKKVQVSTCGSGAISICYEYAEKRICSIDGDAAVQRLQVCKETQYIH
jgi:hypothetical protein